MFVGHTRFSLFAPDSASWRASNEQSGLSEDEYRDYLYDESRLSLRVDIFLNHTVPTLAQAAEGFDVAHIVSYSESLPEKFKLQLQEAAQKYKILYLDELPDGDSGWTAVRRYIRATGFKGVFGRYRLDDDDVLSSHFFRVAGRYIKSEFEGMLVSMPLGVEAIYADQQFFHLRKAYTPMNSMGLMAICAVRNDGVVIEPQSGPHDKSDRFAPVILDSSQMGYLRTIHAGQDNAMRHEPRGIMPRLMENMALFPPFTHIAALEEAFPTVAEQMKHRSALLTVKKIVGQGQQYLLEQPSGDAGFVIEGESDVEAAKDLLVSLWIEDARGRRVPFYKNVEGLAASNDPRIGHFTYIPTSKGNFRTLVSLHFEHGYRLRGFRILARNGSGETVRISQISTQKQDLRPRLVSAERWNAERNRGVRGLLNNACGTLYQNRASIVETVHGVLGEKMATSVFGYLQRGNKSLRR